jgi:hypothetical protein
MADTNDHDAIARRLLGLWLKEMEIFSPAARCSALLTLARVAAELADEEEAKIRDLDGC